MTVALFVITSSIDVSPAFAALAGCAALLVPRLRRRDVGPVQLVREASPGFCVFVLALAVIVDGVTRHGLRAHPAASRPHGTSYLALLALAGLAALLANVVNNLPATLALVPIVAGNPAWVLAVLLGVNIGPNATYPGSLATLLWRRLLPAEHKPSAAQFHRLGLATVPVLLVLAATALWAGLQVVGSLTVPVTRPEAAQVARVVEQPQGRTAVGQRRRPPTPTPCRGTAGTARRAGPERVPHEQLDRRHVRDDHDRPAGC